MKFRTQIAGFLFLAYASGASMYYALHYCHELYLGNSAGSTDFEGNTRHSRHLLGVIGEPVANCSPAAIESFPKPFFTPDVRKNGGVVVYILLALYSFLALAILTDDFFLGSLERISEVLNLKPDVAGATFMAAGSSAPELATGILGVFFSKDDIGVGTVVGSAVYNIAFVVGLCALFAGKTIHVRWWCLYRDCLFYLISIVGLMIVMWNKEISWSDSLGLLVLYILYIFFMALNERVENYFKKQCRRDCLSDFLCGRSQKNIKTLKVVPETPLSIVSVVTAPCVVPCHPDLPTETGGGLKKKSGSYTMNAIADEEENESGSVLDCPEGAWKRILWVLSFPMAFLFYISIPNCKKENLKKYYLVTFLNSCIWISALTYFLVWMITVIGHTWGIPDAVMGLTFLAAGASVPDALASVFVARKGEGNMAISNAIGSNVFDILVCLGVPWFLKTAIVNPGSSVPVYAAGLVYTNMSLLVTILFLLVSARATGWCLNKKLGAVMLLWYLVFMVLTTLYQLNIFNDDNLPTCHSDY